MPIRTPPADYDKVLTVKANLVGEEILVASKTGLPDWQPITPATHLLASHVDLPSLARVVLIGTGPGAVAAVLGRRFPESVQWLLDLSWTALRMAEITLQANGVENTQVSSGIVLPEGNMDVAVIELPKGRKLARRWLLQAYTALRVGGCLYLAGANDQGIQPVIKDADQLFKNSSILGYKKGCRIARMLKTAHLATYPDWVSEPGIAPDTWIDIDFDEPPGLSPLASLPGVFSYDRLDEGSSLLIDNLKVSPGINVLDLGCGYGLLGLFAAQAGAARVDLLDNNQLAIACTLQNISRQNLTQCNAFPSDAAKALRNRSYQLVVTNPPFHAGKEVDYAVTQAFIRQSYPILEPGGQIWMVANRFIRYEDLLERTFGNSNLIAETSKFQVWMATRR
jgi:16S rRNA (guanine1207-N2)-methyltransferase